MKQLSNLSAFCFTIFCKLEIVIVVYADMFPILGKSIRNTKETSLQSRLVNTHIPALNETIVAMTESTCSSTQSRLSAI